MPAVSSLNVRIGADATDFFKTLRGLERDLRVFGMRLARAGTEITTSVSLPLAAFGASAVKAAGDIESLRLALETTFKAAGRTIEEARRELEALRIVAMAPGIDFEQAVRGSIRLQNVGYSAEAARAILVELANAISLTGGTAIELDGVTRQFAQIIAKGRILQEDLTIIQENMPAIGQALKNAFGTSSAERLRELGVSTEELIRGVIIELNKLPRVQGGISNAIVNFFTALKVEMAAFGEAINKAINIEATGAKIISFLVSIRKGFESLSPGLQEFIVKFAAFLALFGPALKVIGGLAVTGSRLISTFKDIGLFAFNAGKKIAQFTAFILQTSAGQAVLTALRTAFFAAIDGIVAMAASAKALAVSMFNAVAAAYGLRTAIIAATFGVAAIIGGIVAAVVALGNAFGGASDAQERFAEGQKKVIERYVTEERFVNEQFAVLKKASSTYEERRKAIDALVSKYPEYLKATDLDTQKVSELTSAQAKLNSEILKRFAIEEKNAALTEFRKQEIELIRKISDLRAKQQAGFSGVLPTGRNEIAVLEGQLSGIRKSMREVEHSFDRAFGLGVYGAKNLAEALQIAENKTEVFIRKNNSIPASVQAVGQAMDDGSQKIKSYLDNLLRTSNETSKITDQQEKSTQKAAKVWAKVQSDLRAFDELLKLNGETYGYLKDRANFLGNAIEKLLKAGFSSTSDEVVRLQTELDELNRRIEEELNTYKKLRAAWAKPIDFGDLQPVVPKVDSRPVTASIIADFKKAYQEATKDIKIPVYAKAPAVRDASGRFKKGKAEEVLTFKAPELPADNLLSTALRLNEALQKMKSNAQQLDFVAPMTAGEAAMKGLNSKLLNFSDIWEITMDNMTASAKAFGEEAADALIEPFNRIQPMVDFVQTVFSGFAEIVLATSNAMVEFASKSADGFRDVTAALQSMASAAVKAATKVVSAWIQQGVAAAVAKALSNFPFPLNLAIAAAAGATAATLFTVAINRVSGIKLAEGGVVKKPTYALIGEYPGASGDPEIVVRESVLRERIASALPRFVPAQERPRPVVPMVDKVLDRAARARINAPGIFSPDIPKPVPSEKKSAVGQTYVLAGNIAEKIKKGLKVYSSPASLKLPLQSRTPFSAFARGGVVKRPTFALIGEYPGANRDPEIVVRQSVLQERMRNFVRQLPAPYGRQDTNGGENVLRLKISAAKEDNRLLKPGRFYMPVFSDRRTEETKRPDIVIRQNPLRTALQEFVRHSELEPFVNTAGDATEKKQLKIIPKIPKLATGGIIRRPTLALLGEYPGVSVNPEIVAPKQVFETIFDDNSQQLTAIIRGDDLYFLLEKVKNKKARLK